MLVERQFPSLDGSKPGETKAKEEISKSEFTPPPTTLREAVFGKATEDAKSDEAPSTEPAAKENVSEMADETADLEERIEELEAEKGAVSSLSTRLEEMKSSGTIDEGLYEKLKKKYTGETDKIDSKIEKLAREEKKKVSNK
jgi:vacuolar-type H+-ATPase subunit I/STV1